MRYLILSDPHANLQALDAVLADATGRGYDHVLVLGDLVGYGADPATVIERVLALHPAALIRGNHDRVCAGLSSSIAFSDLARRSIEWTAMTLTRSDLRILKDLRPGPCVVTDTIEICHGAPFDEDFYVFDQYDASRALDSASRRICLCGHTHVPGVFVQQIGDRTTASQNADGALTLPEHGHVLINVGSVGQPRDGDPRAAYGILDTDRNTVDLRRVRYDVAGAQARIREAGLPDRLAMRLERGE